MKLLLDTHTVLWARADSPSLPQAFRDAIADPANQSLVSAISLAEIAVKRRIGKLRVPDAMLSGFERLGFVEVPFTADHAIALDALPLLHRDPFDRMLIAQAIAEGATLLTVDAKCTQYAVRTL